MFVNFWFFNLRNLIENIFPDLTPEDIDNSVNQIVRQSMIRFVSNHLELYRPKRRSQEKVNLDDITNRYNNSGFDTYNDDSEDYNPDSDG